MCQKTEDLPCKLRKEDFVATDGWFTRWKKKENSVQTYRWGGGMMLIFQLQRNGFPRNGQK